MRTIEIILTPERLSALEQRIDESLCVDSWSYKTADEQCALKLLVHEQNVQKLIDQLMLNEHERMIIYPVEGTLPKPDKKLTEKTKKIRLGKFFSISKEELYSDIEQPVSPSANFILMVVLSAFIAGIGILKDNITITIGAMVIAPFLGPNMALSFGTTLGDWSIIKKSLQTGLLATLMVILISVIWGWAASDLSKISRDPVIEYQDVLLAIFCGIAGVISVLSGQGSTLVGVMVAAALLPPLMRAGLFLGGGEPVHALNSFLIFSTNVICVNITGISVLYLAGIRPSFWWDKENARKKTVNALLGWMVILSLLIITIVLIRSRS